MKTINDIKDLAGKFVLLRVDFNVQIADGHVVDNFRIAQSLPTIEFLRNAGARTVIIAHLGRPSSAKAPAGKSDGTRNEKYTLKPVALALSELMGAPIAFHDDCINPPITDMQDGDIILSENLRFYAGEEENNDEFARKIITRI